MRNWIGYQYLTLQRRQLIDTHNSSRGSYPTYCRSQPIQHTRYCWPVCRFALNSLANTVRETFASFSFPPEVCHCCKFCRACPIHRWKYFSREGVSNTHNSHAWSFNNSQCARDRNAEYHFVDNGGTGIISDSLVGPHLLPPNLDVEKYLPFSRLCYRVFWGSCSYSPKKVVPAWHISRVLRKFCERLLDQKLWSSMNFSRWINILPLRARDFFPIHFMGCCSMKPWCTKLLLQRNGNSSTHISCHKLRPGNSDIFHNARLSMQRCCQACIVTNGRNFEHLL